jgi:hypothetical protein
MNLLAGRCRDGRKGTLHLLARCAKSTFRVAGLLRVS